MRIRFFYRLVERKAGLIDWDDIHERGIGCLAETYRLPWNDEDDEGIDWSSN